MSDEDRKVSRDLVRTLGRLGIVRRSYFLSWGIVWSFPHGQDDGRTK